MNANDNANIKTERGEVLEQRARHFNTGPTNRRTEGRAPSNVRAPMIFKTKTGPRTAAERTQWPRLGGIPDGKLIGSMAFGGPSFEKHYQAGDEATAYVAGSGMLKHCARTFHLPLAKTGWSQLPNIQSRLTDLRADCYGYWNQVDGRFVKYEDGGEQWEMQRSTLLYEPHPNSPVRLVDRGLSITLPKQYGFQAFEKDMHLAMAPASLSVFAASTIGRNHFRMLGIDPTSVARYTDYGFGRERRMSVANEIYIIRPREDFTRIALIAERLVLACVNQIADAND